MQLILINRERLQALGSFLVSELDSMVARIRGAWAVEHNDDDTHGHVHAESVATGRVTFSDIAEVTVLTAQVDNYDPAGFATAALLRLNTALPIVSITGLRVPQDDKGVVLDGRMLVIENASTGVIALENENTASLPRNRVVAPHEPTNVDTSSRVFLYPASLTLLTYNAKKARWIVVSRSNDEVVSYSEFGTSQNDYAPANLRAARVVRVVPTAANLTISGFLTTGVSSASTKTIINEGLYAFSILHQSTSSVAASRVQAPGGVQYRVNPRESVELHYGVDGTWHILLKADQWIDVTFAAGNFTTDTGTWTVAAGDQTTYTYQLDGNMMTVSFDLRTTTVATSPTELRIAVPGGKTIARTMSNAIIALNAGTQISTAYVQATATLTYLQIFSDVAATAWGAATDTTRVQGQITFMVLDAAAGMSESHTDVAHGDTSHSDAEHSDVAHSDVAHGDSHGDTSHTDAAHSDVAAVSSHSDTAHSDVTHVDSHADVAHTDSHGDTAHDDTAHDDTQHTDTAHVDTAHVDTAHGDEIHQDVEHADHVVGPDPEEDHEDEVHNDVAHVDTAHADTAHADTVHVDTAPHGDEAHEDSAHSDTHSDTHTDSHSDTAHTDVAHADTHTDTAHSDTAHTDGGHSDSHADTPSHVDSAHSDVAHGDTAHADGIHSDVGQHTDTAHADI